MRRALLAAGAAVAALGVAGCQQDVQLSGLSLTNACNGETVDLSGILHINANEVADHSGGFNAHAHANLQDVKGVGETTGTTYSVTSGQNPGLDFIDVYVHLNPGFVASIPEDAKFISHGSAPNFLLHTLVHITTNANGDITANVDNGGTKCTP